MIKVYVTSRFKNVSPEDVEALCFAVRKSGMQDFSFVRDVENYQKTFDDLSDLWIRAKEEIAKCDILLIDVSDNPTGGRVLEVGIAYGLNIPVFVIYKTGIAYKEIFSGIAANVVAYNQYSDITKPLSEFVRSVTGSTLSI